MADGIEGERPTLSAVVPCYNEEDGIDELVRRLTAACAEAVGRSYEIVLINDGSRDRTWEKMLASAAKDDRLVCVNLARNHGHQLALSAGLQVCRGERILVIDADLQDPPELLPAMLERLNAGCDVVYGQRAKREGETWFKKVSAALFYRLLKQLVDIDVPLDAGDFRLMSRRALDVLNSMPEQQRFIRGMVSWIGFRQEAFRYDRAARFAGETKYPFSKMLRLALDAITGFSVRPLRLASYLGFMSGMAGLLLLIYTFVSWYHGGTVRGWTSLTAIVLVVSSAQLIVAGVTGEYLGRLYMESKRRPLFVIEDIVRGEQVRRTTSAPKRGERAAEASGA